MWFAEPVGVDEVAFEDRGFLLTRARAEALRSPPESDRETRPEPETATQPESGVATGPDPEPESGDKTATLRLTGTVQPELWNRLGAQVIPKLRSGEGLTMKIDFTVAVSTPTALTLEADLRQVLADLKLGGSVEVDRS